MSEIWTVPSSEPVIAPGQLHGKLDANRAGACHVIDLGDRYRIYYWATDAQGHHHVCTAEAPIDQPNDWTATGSVLERQPGTEHNDTGPSFPFVLPVDDKRWLMYTGCWGKARPDGKLPNTTTVAESLDGGRTFHYVSDKPIIPMDREYDQSGSGSVWVLYEDGLFRMYYTSIGPYVQRPEGVKTGHGERIPIIGIGYAESRDGIAFTKPVDDLVVRPRGFEVEPYEYITSKPSIIVDPTAGERKYTLWVNTFGTAYRVHRLTSADGLNWNWSPRVGPDGELGTGAAGKFDDHQRSYPTLVRHEDELRCWFTGNGFGATGIGYAVSMVDAY